MVVADTSVWIDFLGGVERSESLALRQAILNGSVLLPDLVYYEVLQGCRGDREFRDVRSKLLTLPIQSVGGEELASKAAVNYRKLRALGVTVKTVDCLIATFCIEGQHGLLHRDSDYDSFEQHLGLRVLRPSFQ